MENTTFHGMMATMRVTGHPIDLADLRRCELFSELAEGDLARLANWLVEWEAEAGEVIAYQGDPAEAFFLVCKGQPGLKPRTMCCAACLA